MLSCTAVLSMPLHSILISWAVNCTLAEVSLNKFFSVVSTCLVATGPIGGIVREWSLEDKALSCTRRVLLWVVRWRARGQYFGILFSAIGMVILCRLRSERHPVPTTKKPVLVGFACMVIVSGLLCMLLDEHWFRLKVLSTHAPLPRRVGAPPPSLGPCPPRPNQPLTHRPLLATAGERQSSAVHHRRHVGLLR